MLLRWKVWWVGLSLWLSAGDTSGMEELQPLWDGQVDVSYTKKTQGKDDAVAIGYNEDSDGDAT